MAIQLDDELNLIPRPDPTLLTTEQLLREVQHLRDTVRAELKAEINLTAERFGSVDTRFVLTESQRIEQKSDVKAAVDAALSAQKEAVKEQTTASSLSIAKSEAATNKQLEQLTVTINTAIKGVSDALSDTKDRVSKIEVLKQGSKETYNGLYMILAAGVSILVVVDMLLAWFKK
jgi:hypothetical protein